MPKAKKKKAVVKRKAVKAKMPAKQVKPKPAPEIKKPPQPASFVLIYHALSELAPVYVANLKAGGIEARMGRSRFKGHAAIEVDAKMKQAAMKRLSFAEKAKA